MPSLRLSAPRPFRLLAAAALALSTLAFSPPVTAEVTPRPDLIISGLTLDPGSALAGTRVSALIGIRNVGRAPADLSRVRLYFEPGGGAPSLSVGAGAIAPLAPGESRTLTLPFTVPAVAPGRSYQVWAKVDPDASLPETNNGNNRRDAWLAVTLPDLTITGLGLPSAARANDAVTASIVVRNTSWVPADASTVRLYFESGGGVPTLSLGSAPIDPLAARESRTLVIAFTVPAVAPGRSYQVWAKADPDASLPESNNGNNRRDGWLAVTLPDLTITGLGLPSAARANDAVTASIVVRNGGLVPANASTVRLYFEPGGDIPSVPLGSAPIDQLAAGESHTIPLSFRVPAVAPGRSYQVWAKADPDASLAETNDGNNRRDSWLAVTLPDLTVTGLALPSAARAGDQVKATLRVRNQGRVLANATRTKLFVTSSSNASLDALIPAATVEVPALPSGKESVLTPTVPLPMLAPGQYQLVAVVDGGAAQAETSETNNRRAAAFDIATPTIIIDALAISPSVAGGGQTVTSSLRITNPGRVPTYPTATDVFLATQESSDLGSGISATRLVVPEIPPGGTAQLNGALTAPGNHPGVYYVIAQLDSARGSSIAASLTASAAVAPVGPPGSRKSARLQVTVTVPDLRVTSITATPSSARAGATVVAKGTIQNQGAVLSASTTLRLWLTATPSGSPLAAGSGAVPLGSSPVAGISASGQVSFAISVAIPASTPPGVWYLQAMADAGTTVLESDESNNVASTALTVQPEESASGPVYYVATSGNDGDPGTESQPFRTLSRGVKALTPGATLSVRAGTYAESLMNVIPGGTSWTAPVRVVAYPGEVVVLRPNAGAYRVLHFQGARTAFISVEGLVLDAANVGYDAVKITYGAPSDSAHHIRLLGCEIKNAPMQGILVTPGSDDNEFIDLNVHHNGRNDLHHGFYISSQRNLIEHSEIHANAGSGIQLYSAYGVSVHDNVVRGNVVASNATTGARAGVMVSKGARNRVYNNVIVANVRGIHVDYAATDTDVYNNTLYANEDEGLFIGSGSVAADVRNNIVYASTGPNYINLSSTTAQSHNLFGVDPRFTDPARSDYRVRPDSPAVDAGLMLNLVTTDLDGVSRPQHNLLDIGAFELR